MCVCVWVYMYVHASACTPLHKKEPPKAKQADKQQTDKTWVRGEQQVTHNTTSLSAACVVLKVSILDYV